jgi:four helix bundle protein
LSHKEGPSAEAVFSGRVREQQQRQEAETATGAANLAEGHGRSGRDRLHFWRIASASAKEVDSHLRLLSRAGAVNGAKVAEALETFDGVRAMTWCLLNSRM